MKKIAILLSVLSAAIAASTVTEQQLRDAIERFLSAGSFQRRVPEVIQAGAEKLPPFQIVVDDQDLLAFPIGEGFQSVSNTFRRGPIRSFPAVAVLASEQTGGTSVS